MKDILDKKEICKRSKKNLADIQKVKKDFIDTLYHFTKEHRPPMLVVQHTGLLARITILKEQWRLRLQHGFIDKPFVDSMTKVEYRSNFEREIQIYDISRDQYIEISLGDQIHNKANDMTLLVVGFQTGITRIIGKIEGIKEDRYYGVGEKEFLINFEKVKA